MKLIFLIIGISVLIHQTVAAIGWNGNWAHGCDWIGRDIGNKRVPGSQCSNACEKQPGCTHYTWTTYNGGTCWMKTGTVAKENAIEKTNKTMVCGLLTSKTEFIEWNGNNWAYGCDWNGGDIANKIVPGSDCSNACEKQSGCTHYTWTTYNGGTCWMKGGSVTKADAIFKTDKTIVCGLFGLNPVDPPGKDRRGKLIWSDEFNDLQAFQKNWRAEIGGHGWGNNELQYYTNNLNTRIENGNLSIEARRESFEGRSYTSGRVISGMSFTYGVFEMRARLPKGRGTWSAFWLLAAKRPLNWPVDGEIDILEHVGYDPKRVHAAIHCEKYNHVKKNNKKSTVAIDDPVNTYHNYTLYWGPSKIEIAVDGKKYFSYNKEDNSQASWPFDNPHNIILNLAIGGDWGGIEKVDDSIFPVQYIIDYVRVYEYAGLN